MGTLIFDPHINWTTITSDLPSLAANLLCSIINDNFLTRVVNFPTRQDSVLDLVLVKHASIISCVHTSCCESLPGTDHEAIYFKFNNICTTQMQQKHVRY